MANPTQKPATVRRSLLARQSIAAALSILDTTCSAGTQCPEVQASPMAQQALAALQKAVTTAHGSLTTKQAATQALKTARQTLGGDFKAVRIALSTYESIVAAIAGGDATVITKAGLLVRDQKPPVAALSRVTVVHTKPGKRATEAVLTWPAAAGATGYAIEVNFTPQAPNGTWVALASGTGRRRIVKAPLPQAQFLARVASLGRDGTPSDWSDPVMCTAL